MQTKEEHDRAVGSITVNSKKVQELYHLNEVAYQDLILSADHKSTTGKILFLLITTCKTEDYAKGNFIWLGCIKLISMHQDWQHHCWLLKSNLKIQDSKLQQMIPKFGSQNLKTSITNG